MKEGTSGLVELVDFGHDDGGEKKVVKKWLTSVMETRQRVTHDTITPRDSRTKTA